MILPVEKKRGKVYKETMVMMILKLLVTARQVRLTTTESE